MARLYRIARLSSAFYEKYPLDSYREILSKRARPYAVLLVSIDGVGYAIPFRSSIKHPYCFLTDKERRAGLDFTKAVVVSDDSDVERDAEVKLRQHEFEALKGNDRAIVDGFASYLRKYRKARTSGDARAIARVVEKSSLQYFEHEFMG